MTPEEFNRRIKQKGSQLRDYLNNKLPRYLGKEAVEFFKENFRQGGWRDGNIEKWSLPKRFSETGRAANKYGPLLSRQNELMNSIIYKAEPGRVIISTDKIYAKIHNEGGQINASVPVTSRMRKFAWAKMYERNRAGNALEAQKWKALALTKKQTINVHAVIPKRQFLGDSRELKTILENMIEKHFNDILNL